MAGSPRGTGAEGGGTKRDGTTGHAHEWTESLLLAWRHGLCVPRARRGSTARPHPTSCLDDMVAAPLGRPSWVGVLMGTARGRRRDGGRLEAWVGSPPGRYHAGIFVDLCDGGSGGAMCSRGDRRRTHRPHHHAHATMVSHARRSLFSALSGALYLCLAAAAITRWAARVCGCGIAAVGLCAHNGQARSEERRAARAACERRDELRVRERFTHAALCAVPT